MDFLLSIPISSGMALAKVSIMRSAKSLLAMLVLISSLITGCGCLAADSYGKPACQKYHTNWPHDYYDED